jgi:hypothetical protein
VYATPLGLHRELGAYTFPIGAGDRLVFYTDGLLEARDRAGRFFRLEDCLDSGYKPGLKPHARRSRPRSSTTGRNRSR